MVIKNRALSESRAERDKRSEKKFMRQRKRDKFGGGGETRGGERDRKK
jgi:hypothetical protein